VSGVNKARTRCYRNGKLCREGFPVGEVSEHLAEEDAVVWFDLCTDDGDNLSLLQDELGLHDLAMDDVVKQGQRPKIEHYPNHLFLVSHVLTTDAETGVLTAHEVGAFITTRALVTVHADHGFNLDHLTARWDETASLADSGVSFLLHGLVDYVVDTHLAAVEVLDDVIDGMEDVLFDESANDIEIQRRLFEARKSLVAARRLVLPMREVVNTIMRRDLGLTSGAIGPYFQDVYDHVLRAEQRVDDLRDLVANMLETRLSVRGNRLNQIMKKVTSWAAIFAVPAAVTGFYGQNLPFPGYDTPVGLIASSAIMVAASVALYVTFKRKDWL
jgi:magnesium transporter